MSRSDRQLLTYVAPFSEIDSVQEIHVAFQGESLRGEDLERTFGDAVHYPVDMV